MDRAKTSAARVQRGRPGQRALPAGGGDDSDLLDDLDAAAAPPSPPARAKGGISHDSVQNLSRMIKDLEDQLDRMIAINDSLEKDLEQERRRRIDLGRRVDELDEQLRQAEKDAASGEDLVAELNHLNNERSRLASTVEDLGQRLAELEQENAKQTRLIDRLRHNRGDALEELQSVEAQFDRAMEMVADLRTRLAVMGEERDALKGRLKVSEGKLHQTEEERDALLAEVEESRSALEDIRRSLVDACVVSKQRWADRSEDGGGE